MSKSKKLKASIGYGEETSPSLSLNRDHAKKTQRPMVEDEAIANQLEALLTPAITNQENYYHHDSRVLLRLAPTRGRSSIRAERSLPL